MNLGELLRRHVLSVDPATLQDGGAFLVRMGWETSGSRLALPAYVALTYAVALYGAWRMFRR